jgi:hypothetical protein
MVHMRWNTLVGTSPHAIIEAVHRPAPPPPNANPFGEGNASLRIAQSLRAWPPPGDCGTPYFVPPAVLFPIGLGVSWALETDVNESTGTQVESAAGVMGM